MKEFHNILFFSHGIQNENEIAALQQAIQLAHANHAALEILVIGPHLSESFEQYKTPFEEFIKSNINKIITAAKSALPGSQTKLPIEIEIEWEDTPSIQIIQRVIRKSHDLLIKAAENTESTKGFKALDMALLSKCPCTLFLHRPFKHKVHPHIAVAIDSDISDSPRKDLSINLLELTQHLAQYYKTSYSIISCWDYLLEKFMRSSVWMDVSEADIQQTIQQENNDSFKKLNGLLNSAGVDNQAEIYHVKGDPSELIPELIASENIDMLVMGTVARTGLSGFIIGNTAENILQSLNCSLWALKPKGFISPVKAY